MAEFETIQQMFAQNGAIAQYRNYPDVNFKNWETAYYGNNYASLQKIKTKYDADNNIRSLQSIKLWACPKPFPSTLKNQRCQT